MLQIYFSQTSINKNYSNYLQWILMSTRDTNCYFIFVLVQSSTSLINNFGIFTKIQK